MDKKNLNKKKSQVQDDFNATLHTIIRSLSSEEVNIIDAFETTVDRKDFYLSFGDDTMSSSLSTAERRVSIFRNKSFNKYELVVDSARNSGTLSDRTNAKLSTRPIRNSVVSSTESSKIHKSKGAKYFQRFFPTWTYLKIPFERTTFTSLPYHLNIAIEGKERLSLQVTEFSTIDIVKSKISKKLNIEFEKVALFLNEKRLEGSNLLYNYGVSAKSQMQFKLCETISIVCKYNTESFSLTVFTSITISNMKIIIAQKINVHYNDIELMFHDEMLADYKELFVYNVSEGSELNVITIKPTVNHQNIQGNRTVEKFMNMTDNLKKCKCRELRINVISDIFILMINHPESSDEIKRNKEFLLQFDTKRHYHHISCFKLLSSPPSHSEASSFSEFVSTSYSGSDSSLKSAVFAESKRVERHDSLKIEIQYIKIISECKDFKAFKHLLKTKIGTKCTLRSVALLYKYAREIVRFIGFVDNENSPAVNRMLDFTKLYFEKYFKKDIVDKGGLDALTLSWSEVD